MLRAHLQLPLREEEKIPISQSEFDDLINSFSADIPQILTAEELATLCRVSEDEKAFAIRTILICIILENPPTSGTEETFHQMWDSNISHVLWTVFSTARPIRHRKLGTSWGLKVPNYGLLVKNCCLFRGEERALTYRATQRRTSLRSLYGRTILSITSSVCCVFHCCQRGSYVLVGYHAVGTEIDFVAFTRPPLTMEPLFDHDLLYKRDRVANMVHLIRLYGVISWMGKQVYGRNIPEFKETVLCVLSYMAVCVPDLLLQSG